MGAPTMTYPIIQPPFPLQFGEMTKEELEAYRVWFHQVSPERVAALTNAVNGTPGYESWEPNATPDSLDVLGRWFETQVETRKKTAEEVEETRARLTFPIDIPEEELTNKSYSLAMDIGMYFSQVILKNLLGARWDQPLKNKRFADYGQPVIMGFGTVPLNPVRVMVMTAYGISRRKPARLHELFDTWAKMKR
jgi:hypothetical protein